MTDSTAHELEKMELNNEIRKLRDALNTFILKAGEFEQNYIDLYEGVMDIIDEQMPSTTLYRVIDSINELDNNLGQRREEYDKSRESQQAAK